MIVEVIRPKLSDQEISNRKREIARIAGEIIKDINRNSDT